VGPKHSRDDILGSALLAALEDGLTKLTFGRLAARLGISDRMVVYYFPSKDDLIREVVMSMGLQIQEALGEVLPQRATDHVALVAAAWPVLARAEVDPVFALFFEAAGLAASGQEPYRSLMPDLFEAWIQWASTFLAGRAPHRRASAEAAIATLDGLLLLRHLAGPTAADRAAKVIGVA
jgi:AcrR family transcriptional regulator